MKLRNGFFPDMIDHSNIQSIQSGLLEGRDSMTDLVNRYLSNISLHRDLNIFVEVYENDILEQARKMDEKIQTDPSSLGSLFGLVISIKDVICYKNHGLTAGSRILKGFESLYNATAVEKLLAEDVLIIGRTNCDEFAMGSSNENSVYGPTKNGDDPNRIPGGSSGGAAVSVQMNCCHIALGSDTGGSVRQPASLCGLIGLKPSYGRISRYGLIAYGSSFDQIGIIGRELDDVARVLEKIAGHDENDGTSSNAPVERYSEFSEFRQSRFAVLKGVLDHPMLNEEIAHSCQRLIGKVREKGHIVDEIAFPYMDYLVPSYYVLTTAEASSNLGRYDGIRYGFRSETPEELIELYKRNRTEGFGKEVKRRIMLGTFVLSAGYFDAYYTKAQQVRRLIVDSLNKIYTNYDYIIMPTTTHVAWPIGKFEADPIEMYLSDVFTVLANLAGLPAISINLSKTDENLSYGVQLIGNKFEERKLLDSARFLQKLA